MRSQRLTAGYGLDSYRHRFGTVYDLARTGPILRRAGAIEKCGVCSDASFCGCLSDVCFVGRCRLFPCLFRGWGMGWRFVQFVYGSGDSRKCFRNIPESLFGAFQMTFAVITPALIIGAYVERIKFSAVLIFSSLWLWWFTLLLPIGCGAAYHGQLGCYGFCRRHCGSRHSGNGGIGCCYRDWQAAQFPSSVQPPHSPILTMIGACICGSAGSALTAALLSSRPKCSNGPLGDTYFCSCRFAGLDDN